MSVRLIFEPRDLWIGVYWTKTFHVAEDGSPPWFTWDVYLCLIPCLPIRLQWEAKGGC